MKSSCERNRRSTGTRSSSITAPSSVVSAYLLILRRANSATPPAASRIISSERHASACIIEARSAAMASAVAMPISASMPRSRYSCMLLALSIWWNCSVIIAALSSRPKSKSEPPATASSRQRPPVTPAAQPRALKSRRRGISSRQSRISASAPSRGTVHCTTTRAIETVRNLL